MLNYYKYSLNAPLNVSTNPGSVNIFADAPFSFTISSTAVIPIP